MFIRHYYLIFCVLCVTGELSVRFGSRLLESSDHMFWNLTQSHSAQGRTALVV